MRPAESRVFDDVRPDGFVAPGDALIIINHLNRSPAGEGEADVPGAAAVPRSVDGLPLFEQSSDIVVAESQGWIPPLEGLETTWQQDLMHLLFELEMPTATQQNSVNVDSAAGIQLPDGYATQCYSDILASLADLDTTRIRRTLGAGSANPLHDMLELLENTDPRVAADLESILESLTGEIEGP